MTGNDVKGNLVWKVHMISSSAKVYEMWSTDKGREMFWSEKSEQRGSKIHFTFPDGTKAEEEILEGEPLKLFAFTYFGSVVKVTLKDDGSGGTDLELDVEGSKNLLEELPGWVSVLLALKGAADFGVDLRNHDPNRTWNERYCDN